MDEHELRAELAALTDADLVAICDQVVDRKNLSAREIFALDEIEKRCLDYRSS